jgi:hypothetical protein
MAIPICGGFGDGERAFFWFKHGKPDPWSIHWGVMAQNNAKVYKFYKAAIAAGAKDRIRRARACYRTRKNNDDVGEVSPLELRWSPPTHDLTVPKTPKLLATHPTIRGDGSLAP